MDINAYCDESCHLEHDNISVMVIGAIWCPQEKVKEINKRIREIKLRYNLTDNYELKWTKISTNHYQMYYDVIDYFFDDDDLHYRGVIIPDKALLHHEKFDQTHDEWYYKMFFTLFKNILDPDDKYKIFLDYKDPDGGKRIKKLHEVLCNNFYDFSRHIIKDVQLVRSHQVEIIQLVDILTGAIGYENRSLAGNSGKEKIIQRIKERSNYTLKNSTLYKEKKVNLLVWRSSRMDSDE